MNSKIIQQGAEAVIEKSDEGIIKRRISKPYRIEFLDERIRKLRTRSEAKILERAGRVIPVPRVIKSDDNNKEIIMEFIPGERISDSLGKFDRKKQKRICTEIGENIAKIHNAEIIHGDLTPSNMILSEKDGKEKLVFIDFGLAYISPKIEDKAVDLHLLREAIEANFAENWKELFEAVKKGYSKNPDYSFEAKKILERFTAVERRGRYKKGS